MKIKYYYLIILLFVSIFSINAQVELNANEQKVFIRKVTTIANNTKNMLSDFIQEKHLSIMNNTIISKGKLAFMSPNLVKWEYIEPYKNVALFKEDKLYISNNDKKETLNLKSNKLFKDLNSLIVNSIKGDMFDDSQFNITYFKIDTGYLVIFIPNEKKLSRFIARFELKFSNESTEVEEVKLVEPNDDFTTITFKNKQINTKISDDTFKH
ncbi:LolA family protein [Confluentibacter flavum]|uniref:Cell envelope biogenesis protein LolA n=1 Tax=Confluentibacter flavum TaxID=1909700 RepID=A0A2N3HKI9_9FLAO|nr:outer membrane lipoprotein carrier protein LolA [Confluentibacter flavum]PKQ45485.1 cell envelope biogenesis protein LolA [Confluentibacter flavum]